jgi:hypothetical protein
MIGSGGGSSFTIGSGGGILQTIGSGGGSSFTMGSGGGSVSSFSHPINRTDANTKINTNFLIVIIGLMV